MKNIDFLPEKYHRENALRKRQLWNALVCVAFVLVIGATAVTQFELHRRAKHDLLQIETEYELARQMITQLADLKEELHDVNASADLFTYLRHPWPKTQLLSAITMALSDTLELTSLDVRTEIPNVDGTRRANRPSREKKEAVLEKMLPAERDLFRLKQDSDSSRTVIVLEGATRDTAALHEFLAKLDTSEFFSTAELSEIEHVGDSSSSQFSARLIVKPGYGQPAGPEQSTRNVARVWRSSPRERP